MKRYRPHPLPYRRRNPLPVLLVLWAVAMAASAFASDVPDETLRRLRAERRAASRVASLAKSDGPVRFGLLVIPVEFQDTRFGEGWTPQQNLAPRLDGSDPHNLRNYFDVASRGRLDMAVTLAPIVRLDGDRQDYSGIGYTHSLHSRLLASEAITKLDELGFEFRRLDLDGPDGEPASGDDDGLVDGVLILHAGVGLENDLDEGKIAALQYFFSEPMLADGVGISFFSLASARSGLGIWVHETAHLLGLEDRYDPRLMVEPGAEVLSRGGLGRFSLMSAGAWGTGDGASPALPDAYSCLQLGWLEPRVLDWRDGDIQTLAPTLEAGEAGLIWTHGHIGDEYFVLECRDPELAAPFDGGVYAQSLMIYHVDESLPDGYLIPDDEGAHLHVRLVEADGDGSVEAGDDPGDREDLFGPGAEFGPTTLPSSAGYGGASGVLLRDLAADGQGMSFRATAVVDYDVDLSLAAAADTLGLVVTERGGALADVNLRVEILGGAEFGSLQAGSDAIAVDCVEIADGRWAPATPVVWEPAAELPDGAVTRFGVTVRSAYWDSAVFEREIVWTGGGTALDFASNWDESWTETRPGWNRKTGWFLWPASTGLTTGGTPVLACVDTIFSDGSDWPAVRYNNAGLAVLTSDVLAPDLMSVRLVHRIEGEVLAGSTALDGGLLRWIDAEGNAHAAEPVDGWESRIASDAFSGLAGEEVWTGVPVIPPETQPVWQVDLVPLPREGAGPWRLELVFASDASAYGKGWFVADLHGSTEETPASAFETDWNGSRLRWRVPACGETADLYRLETHDPEAEAWLSLLEIDTSADAEGYRSVAASSVLAALGGSPNDRRLVRVVGSSTWGEVASRPVEIYPDGGPVPIGVLGLPWPNPSADGSVRFAAEVPSGQSRRVAVYDVRGRRIRDWLLPAGQHVLLWDGLDSGGRRAAAGTYLLRMEAQGGHLTRKVVLVH